jgi:ABC-type Fe3+/spermidine/putrescine transport system ATPase subunit
VPHPAPGGGSAGPVRWSADRSPEAENLGPGEEVDLVVRPESLAFVAGGDPRALSGRVTERRYAGPVTYYQVALAAGGELEVLAPPGAAAVGDAVRVAPNPQGTGPAPRIFRRTSTPPAA